MNSKRFSDALEFRDFIVFHIVGIHTKSICASVDFVASILMFYFISIRFHLVLRKFSCSKNKRASFDSSKMLVMSNCV